MEIKAELEPLSGKYYGTKIRVSNEKDNEAMIEIWRHNDFVPSDRELEKSGYTRQQYDNDEEVDNGWGGKSKLSQMDLTCDSHFESQEDYLFALEIVRLLNLKN